MILSKTSTRRGATTAALLGGLSVLVGYCQLHSLLEGDQTPLPRSFRWAVATAVPWLLVARICWTSRNSLGEFARRSLANQLVLGFLTAALATACDAVSALLAGAPIGWTLLGPYLVGRAFDLTPVSFLLACVASFALRRSQHHHEPVDDAKGIEWLPLADSSPLRLRLDDVTVIKSAGNYCEVVAFGQTHLVRTPISKLALRLFDRGFARVHRTALVNMTRVRSVRSEAGRPVVILDDGTAVPVGRAFRAELDERFGTRSRSSRPGVVRP